MRGWQLAVVVSGVAAVVLVVSGFLVFEHGGRSSTATGSAQPPPSSTASYGHAEISARAPARAHGLGRQYNRVVLVRVKDRRSGLPLHGAKVTIHGEMSSPHVMSLYEKSLREVGRGEYKGPYTLIMPGDWRFVIIVTSKQGDTSTSSLPVHVAG